MSEMGKITVSDIATRVIEEDDDGYISIAIKAQVQNGSDETECFITLQGLDRDGFAIYDILPTPPLGRNLKRWGID